MYMNNPIYICVHAENDIDRYPLLSLPDFWVSSCFASNRQQLLPIFLLCLGPATSTDHPQLVSGVYFKADLFNILLGVLLSELINTFHNADVNEKYSENLLC